MILGEDQVHLVGVLGFTVHLLQDAVFGGAGGGHHGLALQVGKVLDARVLLHQHQHAVDEDVVRERDLLLALEVVGGGAALEIDRPVLQQRNAVLRRDRRELDLQLLAHCLFHAGNDHVGDFLRIAGDGVRVSLVRERNRRLAIAHRDHARLLDLGQRVVRLRLRTGRQHGQRTGRSQRQATQNPFGRLQGLHASPPMGVFAPDYFGYQLAWASCTSSSLHARSLNLVLNLVSRSCVTRPAHRALGKSRACGRQSGRSTSLRCRAPA